MIGEGRRSCGWAREGKGDGRGSSIRGRRGLPTGMPANNRPAMACLLQRPSSWGRACATMLHITACLEKLCAWSARSAEPNLANFHSSRAASEAAEDKGEPLLGRHGPAQKRAAWERSARGLRNVQSTPWQVQANVLLITLQPARHCAAAPLLWRESGNAHGTDKSQSHVAENPARVANVIPQRSSRLCLLAADWRVG